MSSSRHGPDSARTGSGPAADHPTSPGPGLADRTTARTALRLGALALAVGALGLALATVAVLGSARGSCRATAWNAVPAAADLPAGWTLGTTQFGADGLAASLVGPASADDPTSAPTVYLLVSCFDGDAATALDHTRAAADAAGLTTLDRSDLGDAGFVIQDASAVTEAIYFRRGGLVAYLTPSGTVDDATLNAASVALVAAVDRAVSPSTPAPAGVVPSPSTPAPAGVVPSPSTPAPAGVVPSPSTPANSEAPAPSDAEGSPSPGASLSPDPSSAASDLLAVLPAEVGGTTLTSDTATGADLAEAGAAGRAMIAALGTLDLAAEDLLVAQAYDANGGLDLYLLAFRAPGTPATDLAPIVRETWLSAGTSGVTTSQVTLSGKELTKVSYGDGGSSSYVRAAGETVIVIETSDETVAAAAAALLP